jgi:hypothetical protein
MLAALVVQDFYFAWQTDLSGREYCSGGLLDMPSLQ